VKTLNEVYSSLSTRRRYEVWFLRFALAEGGGAWWIRYLLMNPGRNAYAAESRLKPVQVWATWFPEHDKPQTYIQGFEIAGLELSDPGKNPLRMRIGENEICQSSCKGALQVDGHAISWNLEYRSTFRVTLSNKGWIGFSRTPHSNARFSGRIVLDGRVFEGNPVGFGVQGHNCGYRHRNLWTWAHAYFPGAEGSSTTLEALVYDMPFGLLFRRAVLWHDGTRHQFRNFQQIRRDSSPFQWGFHGTARDGLQMEAQFSGSLTSAHRLPYFKTDCSGSFDVLNNSLAQAVVQLQRGGTALEKFQTSTGAVLEMAGG